MSEVRTTVSLLATVAAISLASCAGSMRYEKPVDPTTVLRPDAMAYLTLTRGALSEFGPALLPSGKAAGLRDLVNKTDVAAVALLAPALAGAAAGTDPASRTSPRMPGFEAVLVGNFPFRSAPLALSGSAGWRRKGGAYVNAKEGLSVAFPGPTVVLASSGDIAGLVGRLAEPGTSAFPPSLSALCERELVLWLPRPFERFGEALLGEAIEVPAEGLLVAANRTGSVDTGRGQSEPAWDITVAFLMSDAGAARIFRPAVRIAWYGLAKSLFPGEEGISAPTFQIADNLVVAGGLRLRSSTIAAAFRCLSELGFEPAGQAPNH